MHAKRGWGAAPKKCRSGVRPVRQDCTFHAGRVYIGGLTCRWTGLAIDAGRVNMARICPCRHLSKVQRIRCWGSKGRYPRSAANEGIISTMWCVGLVANGSKTVRRSLCGQTVTKSAAPGICAVVCAMASRMPLNSVIGMRATRTSSTVGTKRLSRRRRTGPCAGPTMVIRFSRGCHTWAARRLSRMRCWVRV